MLVEFGHLDTFHFFGFGGESQFFCIQFPAKYPQKKIIPQENWRKDPSFSPIFLDSWINQKIGEDHYPTVSWSKNLLGKIIIN